jgi:hypothetical protein
MINNITLNRLHLFTDYGLIILWTFAAQWIRFVMDLRVSLKLQKFEVLKQSSGMLYFVWLGECLPTFKRSFETLVATQPTTHRHIQEHLNHAVFSCHECEYPKYFQNGGFLLRCALLAVTSCAVVGGAEPDVAQYWRIVWHTAAVTELSHANALYILHAQLLCQKHQVHSFQRSPCTKSVGTQSFSSEFYIEFDRFFTKSLIRLTRKSKGEVKIDHRATGKWTECNVDVFDVSPSEFWPFVTAHFSIII